mgnify:CR=1 FL=1
MDKLVKLWDEFIENTKQSIKNFLGIPHLGHVLEQIRGESKSPFSSLVYVFYESQFIGNFEDDGYLVSIFSCHAIMKGWRATYYLVHLHLHYLN